MRKGFTLIELLAVIVILAIIALIATPIVLNIIKDSRESAGLRSAEMYLDAVEQSIALEKMNNTNFNPNTCTITTEGNLLCDEKDLIDIEVNGEKPVNGSITFESGKIKKATLEYKNDKVIVMNTKGKLQYQNYISISNYQHKHTDGTIGNHEVTFDSNGHGTCTKCNEEVLAAGLYDENDNLVASWDTLVNDYGLDITFNDISFGGGMTTKSFAYIENNNTELFSSVTRVVADNSFSTIGTGQFASLNNIIEIILPNSVTSIGNYAFNNCTSLTTIEIPNSVTNIGGCAFQGCTGLISIEIPESVTSIGNQAFSRCTGLISIEIPDNVTSINQSTFSGCTSLTTIEIPESVTSIGSDAFRGCTGLTEIEIPDNVTTIGTGAFHGCTGLTSIYIPNSVTTVKRDATYSDPSYYSLFINCLSSLKIYTGVKEDEIPSGWGTYWNYYDSSNTLNVTYGVTREEYESLIG